MVAPAIRESDGSWQHTGGLLTPWGMIRAVAGSWAQPPGARTIREGDAPVRTDWLCGAALMVRSKLFRELGGFDPRFFLYFEETDLCRRAAKAGAELWAVGSAVAEHSSGASALVAGEVLRGSRSRDHFFRSRFYYLAKHHGYFQAVSAELAELVFLAFHSLRHRLRGRRGSGPFGERLRAPLLRTPKAIR
jgi:GT2 family glycosyltransferase